MIINGVVFLLILLADQLTKYAAVSYIKPVGSITALKGLLNFTYVENTGVAFGLFSKIPMLILPLIIVIFFMCVYVSFKAYRKGYRRISILLTAVAAGAAGNILDKIFRKFVVDFIEFSFFDFPVFNFADVVICVGITVFAILILFTKDGDFFENNKPE